MSSATTLCPAILATILAHLAPHFLASTGGDLAAARLAATRMLAAYNAETEDELRLTAEIVSFGFHALDALSRAVNPDLPLSKVLRLRGNAVSLSRESHKARRRLDQIQRARLAHHPALAQPSDVQPSPAQPQIEPAAPQETVPGPPPARVEPAPPTHRRASGNKHPRLWTLANQQRSAALRITENLKRNQAEQVRLDVAKATSLQAESTHRQSVS